jgi:hypothetical protein
LQAPGVCFGDEVQLSRAFSALVESEGDSLAGVNYDSC